MEEPSYSGDASLSSSMGIKLPEERDFLEQPLATPPDAEEELSEPKPPGDDITEQPMTTPFTAIATPSASSMKKAPPEADTVSTGEELLQWLSDYGDTGGVVRLSDDIYLCDFIYVHGFRQPAVTIDTGEFSIIVADGYAEFHAGSPLTIRGLGGENGVLRAAGGGVLQINGLTLEAEEGYAAFQEEGAGLLIEQTSLSGAVHYAKQPYVLQWEDALVVEGQGQILDAEHLPAVLDGRVIRQGRVTDFYEDVPVTWDLTGHEEAQKERRRFTVTGEFENMASQKAPVCTIVYDDFPLTFLEVTAKWIAGGRGDIYKFTGTFSKPEDRLPITIAQEYSFDGESWMLYEYMETDRPNDTFTILLSSGTVKQSTPDIFIRLSWDDGGTMYYSNVLRFTGDSLEESEEHGGNRGGGTNIIDPPETPEPETTPPPEPSEPEPTPPPEPSEPEPTPPPEPSEPETAPPPEPSEPEPTPPPEPSEPEPTPPPEPSEPEPTPPPEPSEPEPTPPPEPSEPETAPPEPSEPETTPPETPEPATNQPGNHDTGHEAGGDGGSSSAVDSGGQGDTQGPAQGGTSKTNLSGGPPGSGGGEPKSPSTEADRMHSNPPPDKEAEPPESYKDIPADAEETTGRTPPVKQPEGTMGGTLPSPEDNSQTAAKPGERSASQRQDAGSAVAGLAAIAASMGGAAFYLHPKARKWLMGRLWDLFKR